MLRLLGGGVNRHGLPSSQQLSLVHHSCPVPCWGAGRSWREPVMFVLGSGGTGDRAGAWMTKPDIMALGVQERVLLFCLGSGTDWKQAGVTLKTVAHLLVKFLVMPNRDGRLFLTDAGRAALRDLLPGP